LPNRRTWPAALGVLHEFHEAPANGRIIKRPAQPLRLRKGGPPQKRTTRFTRFSRGRIDDVEIRLGDLGHRGSISIGYPNARHRGIDLTDDQMRAAFDRWIRSRAAMRRALRLIHQRQRFEVVVPVVTPAVSVD
jgi:hypothetical protein